MTVNSQRPAAGEGGNARIMVLDAIKTIPVGKCWSHSFKPYEIRRSFRWIETEMLMFLALCAFSFTGVVVVIASSRSSSMSL